VKNWEAVLTGKQQSTIRKDFAAWQELFVNAELSPRKLYERALDLGVSIGIDVLHAEIVRLKIKKGALPKGNDHE
jgi:hypothetical protein